VIRITTRRGLGWLTSVKPASAKTCRVPGSLGRLEPDEEGRTRLRATTDEPDWYVRQLAAIPAPFRVIGSPEVQRVTAEVPT